MSPAKELSDRDHDSDGRALAGDLNIMPGLESGCRCRCRAFWPWQKERKKAEILADQKIRLASGDSAARA